MSAWQPSSEIIGSSGIDAATVTVATLAEAMASQRLTAAELTAFYLDRIERGRALGAVISVSRDAAEQASAIDQALADGAEPGPLAGIPVLIKDNIAADGAPATAGSPAMLGAEAKDAFLVGRLRAVGAVDRALTEHGLDAVVTLTGNPAWLTDYVLGDHYTIGTSSSAAVSGYPAITVPAGRVAGLPVGISFIGSPWNEPRLLALAYAFEQARSLQ